MSTKSTLRYWSRGSCQYRTELGWHIYHECRDDSIHLEVDFPGGLYWNITLGKILQRVLLGRVHVRKQNGKWERVR